MSEFSQDYLLYLLAQASHSASSPFHAELAEQDISTSEWRVLASLHPDLQLTVGELARECLLQTSTLSRSLDRMERDGKLRRSYNARDRRQVRVSLTEDGARLADKLVVLAKQREAQLLDSYQEEDIAALKATLQALIAHAQSQ